jgi:hypothetical protein
VQPKEGVQPIKGPQVCKLISQPVSQKLNRSTQSVSQPVDRSVNQSTIQSTGQQSIVNSQQVSKCVQHQQLLYQMPVYARQDVLDSVSQ